MPKVAAVFTPPSDHDTPDLDDLGLGNRATRYNKLTWERACKVVAQTGTGGGNPLRPELKIGYYRKSSGEGAIREDAADPCARGAVKQALKRAQGLVETNQAISAFVYGRMQYTFGGDQPRHHARWGFGEWRRADDAGQLDGARRRRKAVRR